MKTIVQFGTNNGDDHVSCFCNKNKNDISKIVLVEPFAYLNESITNSYKGLSDFVDIHNIVILPNYETQTLMYYNDLNLRVSSVYENHVSKHKRTFNNNGLKDHNIKHVYKNSINVNLFFETNKLFLIDFLFIDIEGLDLEIIKAIDYDRFDIKHIIFEVNHIDNSYQSFFESKGYIEDVSFHFKEAHDKCFKKI